MNQKVADWITCLMLLSSTAFSGCSSGPSKRDKAIAAIRNAEAQVKAIEPNSDASEAISRLKNMGFVFREGATQAGNVSCSLKVDSGPFTAYVLQLKIVTDDSRVLEIKTKVVGIGP